MLTFFQEGGFVMFFLLAFGLSSLILATRFAMVPGRTRFRMTLGMSTATLFTTLTGVATDLATVGHQVPRYLKQHPGDALPEVVLQGIAESLAPAILGFTMLALTALLVSVGVYREPAA